MAELLAALVDGEPATSLPLTDGGLAYGDGLFETVLFREGRAALIDLHLARLAQGLERLGLPAIDHALLRGDSARLARNRPAVVLKWIVTRGDGSRGYLRARSPAPRRIVLAYAATALPDAHYRDGVTLGDCASGYATPASLAGLKHLNRLEQVIARSGLTDPNHYDGLMFDPEFRVISATSANLFFRFGTALATPRLDRCGVAGVCRAALLASPGVGPVVERDIHRDELATADELILTNSVRGALPVRAYGSRRFASGALIRAATAALAERGFAPLIDDARRA